MLSSPPADAGAAGASSKLEMTAEEAQRFERAMQDETFRKMFAEYMHEISDPKNRERYEAEIVALEAERSQKVTFLHPTPGFVIKTTLEGEARFSAVPDAVKVFVNVCSHAEIAPAAPSGAPEAGGQRWTLPHSLLPVRPDRDHAGATVAIVDCVFNPNALERAKQSEAFAGLLTSVAFDAIAQRDAVVLSANSRRLHVPYKGPPPNAILRDAPAAGGSAPAPPADLVRSKVPPAGPEQPRYTLVEQKPVDLADYTHSRDAPGITARPASLRLAIELPRIASAAKVDLDLSATSVNMSVPGVYELAVPLPYPVDSDASTATFDKSKRILTLSLPVCL